MKKYGIICVLISAILFAFGGILMKINSWNSVAINGARCLFAFLVMLIYIIIIGHRFRITVAVLAGALAHAGCGLTFAMATKMTTAANAIVLQFTMPVFVIVLLWIFWKQRPDRTDIITVLFAFVGIVCFFVESLSAGNMMGNMVAVFSGLLYALVFLIKKMPNSDFESSVLISHLLNFLIGIPFIIRETDYSTINIVSVVVLGVFQLGLAFVLLNIGLNSVSPVTASLISMVEPILNPILVALFYGEKMGLMAIIGSVIVLGSACYNASKDNIDNNSEKGK